MKKNIKRIIAMLLAGVILLGFAACNNDDKPDIAESSGDTEPYVLSEDENANATLTENATGDVSDPSAPAETETDSDGNIVSQPAAQNTRPSTTAEILAAYTLVMDNAKTSKPGFTKSEWQDLPKDKRNFGSLANTIIGLANLFMISEEDAKGDKKEVREKGYNMEWFPLYKHSTKGCLLTDTSKIKSAKCEVLSNGNYRITIVLKDDMNPEPYAPVGTSPGSNGSVAKGFVGQMFNPLAKSDIDNTLQNDERVNKVVKDATYSLKYYDCTAVLTYNPANNQIVSLNQYMHVLITANAKVLGMTLDGDAVLDNYMQIQDFKY